MLKKGLLFGVALIVATLMACGGDKNNTVAPTSTAVDGTEAASDGSTLKVAAPTPTSPTDGVTLDSRATTLIVTNASGTYVTPSNLKYRFVVETAAGATVLTSGQITAGTSSTSYAIADRILSFATAYRWRARAEQGSLVGPWSPYFAFSTVTKIEPWEIASYQTSTTLWDNLTDGKTIGTTKNVQWVAGKGVKMVDHDSYVMYTLQNTLSSGSVDFMVEGLASISPGSKTKVFSMAQGYGDITANAYRFTLEKRGKDAGGDSGKFRFRVITGNNTTAVYDSDRFVPSSLVASQAYAFHVTWGGGVVTLSVRQGSSTGTSVLNASFTYKGTYSPSPHVVYIGSSLARGGAGDSTVPGMIVRYFYVSPGQPWPAAGASSTLGFSEPGQVQ
jgi:hypothetical protein